MNSAIFVSLGSELTMRLVNAMKFVHRVISVSPMNVFHALITA